MIFMNILQNHIPGLSLTTNATLTGPKDSKLDNAKHLLEAFKDAFGANYVSYIEPLHISQGLHINIITLMVFLYQTLPCFVPKAVIEFQGPLHSLISKSIEIANNSSRAITYSGSIIGSPEFTLSENMVTIGPKSQAHVNINFKSRFLHQVNATLILKSKKIGLNLSSILIYNLSSLVEVSGPLKSFEIRAPMYSNPPSLLTIPVHNPFDDDGMFLVQLSQNKLSRSGSSDHVQRDSFSPPSFQVNVSEIAVKAKETIDIQIRFIPFELGAHECLIHFVDPKVGEFNYKIDAEASLPQPVETLTWSCNSVNKFEKSIRVSPNNSLRDKAIYTALSPFVTAGKEGHRKPRRGVSSSTTMEREIYQLPRKPLRYKVVIHSSILSGPDEVTLKPLPDQKELTLHVDSNVTEIPLIFNPKASGRYNCRVVLICLDVSDVRTFNIQCLVRSEGITADLEFTTNARHRIVQDIPITNTSNEDWTISAALQAQYFTCPVTIIAKAKAKTMLPIAFLPNVTADIQGSLVLNNMSTNQRYFYRLLGHALDPLPESTVSIECTVRSKVFFVKFRSNKHF